jgi:hypothetical protein
LLLACTRQEPHRAALAVFAKYGGQLLLDLPVFSPKWLTHYRPVWLVQKIVRTSPAARWLERLGLLPRRYHKVAHFDADSITLTAYGYPDVLQQAAREISAAMGVDIKLVKQCHSI